MRIIQTIIYIMHMHSHDIEPDIIWRAKVNEVCHYQLKSQLN